MAHMIKNPTRRLGAAPGPCDGLKTLHENAVKHAAESELALSAHVANYQKHYPNLDPETMELLSEAIDDAREYLNGSDSWVQKTKEMWDGCVNGQQNIQAGQQINMKLIPAGIILLVVGYLSLR